MCTKHFTINYTNGETMNLAPGRNGPTWTFLLKLINISDGKAAIQNLISWHG